MIRTRTARLLTAFLVAACANASPLAPGMKAVEEIRGRKFLREVKNTTIDRTELAKHLEEQMAKTTPYPLEDWGAILRSLQLVDVKPDQILPRLLTLYESQVLAFYDPQAHIYYSIRQMPDLPPEAARLVDAKTLEETVMVHELVHALQDQHFSLAEKEKQLMRDTDANLAYHAVLEGEAVLVMVANMLQKNGIALDEVVRDEAMLGMISSAAQAERMMDPSTPRYFAEMLKFPYLDGLKFVVAAYRRGGWKEVDKVHANPPRTTREILNPDDYFQGTFKPRAFDATKPAGALATEHLGAFHWRFLVGADASQGWVNDRVVIFPDRRVQIEAEWESEQQADAFARAYESILEKRGLTPTVARKGTSVTASYTAKP